jgi:hypothetical protein
MLQSAAWGLGSDFPVPGDYDGDGRTDFAVVREGATPTSALVWWILRSSDGSVTGTEFGLSGSDLLTQNDYDGDGRTDIAVWRDTNGFFYVLPSNGSGFFGRQWGLANDIPVANYDSH